MRFTDHNQNLVIPDDGTYLAAGGFSASARQRQEGLQTRNLDCVGVINSDAITQEDLRAGRYREAQIEEQAVDWRYPMAGPIYGVTYWIEEVTFDGSQWNAKVSDISRWLRVSVGDVYARNCRYDLGDTGCKVNLAAITVSASVTTIDNQRKLFRASALTGADNKFQYGKIVWTSGDNDGLISEVKAYVSATKQLKLQLVTPFDFQIGDTFDIYPGCGKTTEYCKGTSGTQGRPWANNLVNFGGFPTIPGTDKILQTPNAK